jgi:hypothetical protein
VFHLLLDFGLLAVLLMLPSLRSWPLLPEKSAKVWLKRNSGLTCRFSAAISARTLSLWMNELGIPGSAFFSTTCQHTLDIMPKASTNPSTYLTSRLHPSCSLFAPSFYVPQHVSRSSSYLECFDGSRSLIVISIISSSDEQ